MEMKAMRDAFISAMGHAAHSVSVVVTDGDAGRMGVTVSAVSSVSADPPMILACINRKSPAVAAICANGSMTINMLAATQHDISDVFSGRSQKFRPYDFACAQWTRGREYGSLFLNGASTSFHAVVETKVEAGTHMVIIGRVMEVNMGGHDVLVHCRRNYGQFSLIPA